MTDYTLQLPTHNASSRKEYDRAPNDGWIPTMDALGNQVGLCRFQDSGNALDEMTMARITSAPGRSCNLDPPSPMASVRMSRNRSAPAKNRAMNTCSTRASPSTFRTPAPIQKTACHTLVGQQPLGYCPDLANLPAMMGDFGGETIQSLSSNGTTTPFDNQVDFNRLQVQSLGQHSQLAHMLHDDYSHSTPTTGELTMASNCASNMSRQTSTASNFIEVDHQFSYLEPHVSNFSDLNFREEVSPHVLAASFELANGMPIGSSDEGFHKSFFSPGVVDDACSFPNFPPVSFPFDTDCDSENTMREASHSLPSEDMLSLDQTTRYYRRQQQIAQNARRLAPKVAANEPALSSSSHKVYTVKAEDGNTKQVAAISKAPYVRPTYPKKMCLLCDEQPEGFRGEHELRRHVERAHSIYKKVWVTVDASPNKDFLSNCKSCRRGKQYGVYYNAAAHLRRAHFNPCKRGRGRGRGSENRGGMGGGNDPPMELLKNIWMKEIEVYEPKEYMAPSNEDVMNSDESPTSTERTQRSPDDFGFAFEDITTEFQTLHLPTSAYVNQADHFSYHDDVMMISTDDYIDYDSSQLEPSSSVQRPNDAYQYGNAHRYRKRH